MVDDPDFAIRAEERLDCRVAIVVGGGWNIGRALAERLASAGAAVVLSSRRAELLHAVGNELTATGAKVLVHPADATDPRQVHDLVEATLASFGRLDIVIVAAGNSGARQRLDCVDGAELQRVIADNLLPPLLMARATLPHFLAHDRGEYLFLVGGGAFFPQVDDNLVVYAAAKAGICRMVDQLQAELLESKIRVHGLEPGLVLDPQTLARIDAEERRSNVKHPLRRQNNSPMRAAALGHWMVCEASRPLRGRVVSIHDDLWRDKARVDLIESSMHALRLRRSEM